MVKHVLKKSTMLNILKRFETEGVTDFAIKRSGTSLYYLLKHRKVHVVYIATMKNNE